MKKIADRIQEEMAKCQSIFGKDKGFQELQKFYEEMRKNGIAKKQEYNIPPLDTIGHRLYCTK